METKPDVSARLAELEKLAGSPDPDTQKRAKQELVDLTASMVTGRQDFFFYTLKIGTETITIRHNEREELAKQANLAKVAVQSCLNHDPSRGIRCQCCDSFRKWFWSLREGPLQRVASALWDRLDSLARHPRQKQVDPTVQALVVALENRSEDKGKFK